MKPASGNRRAKAEAWSWPVLRWSGDGWGEPHSSPAARWCPTIVRCKTLRVKILRFGSSNDTVERFVAGEPRDIIIQRELERELGEPVTVVTKRIWPSDRFPGLVSSWIDEERPDVVTIPVIGYWFNFESVPLKLQRRFGRFGETLGNAGQRSAEIPWLAHNAAFRGARQLAQRTLGGATYFTCDEVIKCIGSCVREVAQREGIGLIVQGPYGGQHLSGASRRAIAREEARRQTVNAGVREVCSRHRVRFIEHRTNRREQGTAFSTIGDALHMDEVGQRASALEWAGIILAEIRRLRDEAVPPPEAR